MDETYDALVFEADATSVGTRLLMFGAAKTLYRLSIVFNAEGTGTRVTITGQAVQEVRDRIDEAAAKHGRSARPRHLHWGGGQAPRPYSSSRISAFLTANSSSESTPDSFSSPSFLSRSAGSSLAAGAGPAPDCWLAIAWHIAASAAPL